MTANAPDPGAAIARGLAVFPLPPGGKIAGPGWHSRIVADVAELTHVWRPGDNIGIGCCASQVVGIDLDRHDETADGLVTFQWLCDQARRPWPKTFTVRTPNNGLHLYFQAPAGMVIGSSIGKLGPGIDVRAPGRRLGGYLVGPGSRVGGRAYTVARDVPIVPLPTWLAGRLARPRRIERR